MESEKRESIFKANTEKTRVGLETIILEEQEYIWLGNIHQNHQW